MISKNVRFIFTYLKKHVKWILKKKFSCFNYFNRMLVSSSYQYHIGDVPYMFHMCSIYDPYIFQYYKDMEYIWNIIGS